MQMEDHDLPSATYLRNGVQGKNIQPLAKKDEHSYRTIKGRTSDHATFSAVPPQILHMVVYANLQDHPRT